MLGGVDPSVAPERLRDHRGGAPVTRRYGGQVWPTDALAAWASRHCPRMSVVHPEIYRNMRRRLWLSTATAEAYAGRLGTSPERIWIDWYPPASSSEWRSRRACAGVNVSVFFPESRDPHRYDAALAVCAGCEVRGPCLAYACAHNETYGVWGGRVFDATPRSALP